MILRRFFCLVILVAVFSGSGQMVFPCSVELSIALVFEEGDQKFSDIVVDIDKLLRKVAIPISQGQTIEFPADYYATLTPLFSQLAVYDLSRPPAFIYDQNLWNEYHGSLRELSARILSNIRLGNKREFHDAVQKIEDVFLTIYRNRGKRDHRIIYPSLVEFRKNPDKITLADMDSLLNKVSRSIELMQPNGSTEDEIHSNMKKMKILLEKLRQRVEKPEPSFEVFFEEVLSDIMRIENAILNLRWFLNRSK